MSKEMQALGIQYAHIDEYVFASHSADIIKCFDSFDDDTSRELYADLITWRIQHIKPDLPFPYRTQYFAWPEFMAVSDIEVYVDCGAFTGDTIERYIYAHDGTFGKIFAFEMDDRNFEAMKWRTERLEKEWALETGKICLLPYGVGKEKSEMQIIRSGAGKAGLGSTLVERGTMASWEDGGQTVQVVALDDFFKEQRVDFIKADIESFEYDMLRGAEKIIRRDTPKLAICIYHNATDMFRTMLWLKKIDTDYRFRLCHHSATQAETVLYAYKTVSAQ